MTRISGARPVRFRLHIDHIENPERDVWAVRFGRTYLTVRSVRVYPPIATIFRGAKARQPRAFLTGHGTIYLSADKRKAVIL